MARPATCGAATVASGVRPVFSNTRQKPLPLGAGTIRGGVPSMSTSAPVSSVVHIPTIISQPTIANLSPLEETELMVSTASVSHSPGMPNLKKPSEIYHIPINKQKKMAWVESQIKKDQHEAVNPNFRTSTSRSAGTSEPPSTSTSKYVTDCQSQSDWNTRGSPSLFLHRTSLARRSNRRLASSG